jgi:hypothetical protein
VTSNSERAEHLARALRAALDGDRVTVSELCTPDVKAWTPRLSASSLDELLEAMDLRDPAFTDFALETYPLDVGRDLACVEWTVTMTHTAPLELSGGGVVEPTGLRITAIGVTIAEFRGPQICAVRQYWDESMLLDQLGLTPAEDRIDS